jgi:mannosyltransferase OCH1-like enzyme
VSIPRLLHQIWVGPRPIPERWTGTWRRLNPDFGYRLWDEGSIEALGLRNGALYRRYLRAGIFDGAADVARIEILHRFGGVYVDADSVALRPIAGAWFLGAGFFAAHEPNDEHPGLVSNAFMGSVPGHPVLERYVESISRVRSLRPMWRLTGPGALTDVLAASPEPDIAILPAWTFFTGALHGPAPSGGRSFATHLWSTTAARWGTPGTSPYPIDQLPNRR